MTTTQRVITPRRQTPALIRWSLLLFIIALPFEAVDLGGVVSLARLAGVPFFLACLFAPRLCFRWPLAPVWWFWGYLGVVVLEGLLMPSSRSQPVINLTMVQFIGFFWIAVNLFRDRMLAARAMRSYAIASVALALGVLAAIPGFTMSLETHESAVGARLTAVDYNPNGLAAMAAIAAVILVGIFLTANRKVPYRLLAGMGAAVLAILIIRTGSRSGAVALLAGLAVFLFPTGGNRRGLLPIVLAGVVLLGTVSIVVTNPLMKARWTAAYHGDSAGRDRIYETALQMIRERPIVGWGPGSGIYELGGRLGHRGVRGTHNLLLHLLLEVGIIGTIPLIVGLLLVVRAAWQGRKGPLGLVPLALVAVVVVANAAHTELWRKPMWFVLAVAMASAVRGKNVQRVAVRNTDRLGVQATVVPETGNT